MNLDLDKRVVEFYKSPSQKIRVLSEDWVNKEAYCPNCGNVRLNKYSNNKPVADFFCGSCNEDFELKSKRDSWGKKIVDGAYETMLRRLRSQNNPNLFLLNYDWDSLEVSNLLVVPKHYFVPDIIEERKPLSPNAERAHWIGCNILLRMIPDSGRIFLVKNKHVEPKEKVFSAWKKTLFLRQEKEMKAKGWLLDVMRYVEKLGKKEFILNDVYTFEQELKMLHPCNRHIKDKIRQQLQLLRDRGYIQFIDKGRYRLT